MLSGQARFIPMNLLPENDKSTEPAEEPLTRTEVQHALQISNKEAVAATVHATLSGGAFQTGFALFLGASSFWVGVLSAFPTLAGLSQIFSSLLIERNGQRRKFTATFAGTGRLLWLPGGQHPAHPALRRRRAE